MGNVSYYPTGVCLYKPEKCYNGYTLYACPGGGAVVIDMHGNECRRFENITGFPLKMLPNGHIMGSSAEIPNHLQDMADLIEIDWDGNIVWNMMLLRPGLQMAKNPFQPFVSTMISKEKVPPTITVL